MFRLHVDVPLGEDLEVAKSRAEFLLELLATMPCDPALRDTFQYRLGKDDDRGAKNYFKVNENGHAGTGKLSVTKDVPRV